MKKLIKTLIIIFCATNVFANDMFVMGIGKSFSEARTAAKKIVYAENLRVVGQTYTQDRSGNWSVTLKVRKNSW